MSDNMIRIQIEAGCPSGNTEGNWNKAITLNVHERLAEDFVGNLMEYAQQESQEDYWQVHERHILRVTYETVVENVSAEDLEAAVWVSEHEIARLPDGTSIRADAEELDIEEA